MTCPLCIHFVHDTLESHNTFTNHSCEKLQPLTRTIAFELVRLLTTISEHHNMVLRVKREYCNLVEKKIHTPAKSLELHLFDVSLNYYKWSVCNESKQKEMDQTIQLICHELLCQGVFKCVKSKDPLLAPKEWILQKYFFLLEHLKAIHEEHSGNTKLDLDTLVFKASERISEEEIASWNDLYT